MKKAEAGTVYIAYAPNKGADSLFQGQPLSVWTKDCDCPLGFWCTLWNSYEIKSFDGVTPEFTADLQIAAGLLP